VIKTVLAPLLLVALGAAAAALIEGTAGTAIAILLVGSGCVLAVSLVFWHIGRGEDRDRDAGRS
jgi:hypothetical protein